MNYKFSTFPIFIKDRDLFLSIGLPETRYEAYTAHELTVILVPPPPGVAGIGDHIQFWEVCLYSFYFIVLLGLNLGPRTW